MRPMCAVFLLAITALSGCYSSMPPVETQPATEAAPTPAVDAPAPTPAPEIAPMPATETEPPATPATAPEVETTDPEASTSLSVEPFLGDYADEFYAQRGEGYDWVGVTIEKIHDQEAYIKVRARGDKKRPTCTFDGVGRPTSENVLEVDVEGKPLVFTLDGDTLTASVRSQDDESLLYYPCSGGASLAGPYTRLADAMDASQLPPEAFSTVLSLQNVTFTISANDVMPMATLVIRPEGLEQNNTLIVRQVDGTVMGAEIEDLDSDGWPEVVVYVSSAGSGSYGTVVGYSVSAGESLSAIAFPELDGDAAAGYMGHDEFTLVETSLARRFPVYKEGDSNAEPTGTTRQIQYELIDGEASRTFSVKNVTEIPAP